MTKFSFESNQTKTSKVLEDFLNPNNYFYKELSLDIAKDHPSINIKGGGIKEYVSRYYKKHDKQINKYKDMIANSWNEKWPRLEKILSNILSTNFTNSDHIKCNIGIARIYPRDLTKKELQVCYLDHIDFSEGVIIHEVTHFLYFNKWRKLFPKDNPERFEAPDPIWHLSEISAPIIINNKDILNLIPNAPIYCYPEQESSFNEFQKLYKHSESIEEYLKEARKIILDTKI